jgi:hypothetical protein
VAAEGALINRASARHSTNALDWHNCSSFSRTGSERCALVVVVRAAPVRRTRVPALAVALGPKAEAAGCNVGRSAGDVVAQPALAGSSSLERHFRALERRL